MVKCNLTFAVSSCLLISRLSDRTTRLCSVRWWRKLNHPSGERFSLASFDVQTFTLPLCPSSLRNKFLLHKHLPERRKSKQILIGVSSLKSFDDSARGNSDRFSRRESASKCCQKIKGFFVPITRGVILLQTRLIDEWMVSGESGTWNSRTFLVKLKPRRFVLVVKISSRSNSKSWSDYLRFES